jgi:Zn-finger nucleic acid-binding protein
MSPQMISCPGCRSKIRFNEKSGRTELKCPRCRKVFGVTQTGSVNVQQTSSLPIQRAEKEGFKDTDSKTEIRKQRNATPTAKHPIASGRPQKVRKSTDRDSPVPTESHPDVALLKRTSFIARPEVQMFLIGLVTALVVGFSGLTLFMALRPDAAAL